MSLFHRLPKRFLNKFYICINEKKIAIIGSGIAGLTLANLLKTNSNFEFVIYEKAETLNLDEGFGIQLSVNSVFILNKIGFNQLDKNEKYHPSKLDFYSINCNKICDLNLILRLQFFLLLLL